MADVNVQRVGGGSPERMAARLHRNRRPRIGLSSAGLLPPVCFVPFVVSRFDHGLKAYGRVEKASADDRAGVCPDPAAGGSCRRTPLDNRLENLTAAAAAGRGVLLPDRRADWQG